MNSRIIFWVVTGLIYVLFTFWYTNTGGPLTEDEIADYQARFAANGQGSEEAQNLLRFMREDTGRQFIMVNNIDLNDNPPEVPGAPGADATELMSLYMEYMWPALLQRASHPIFAGAVVNQSMDVVGIDNAMNWDQGALMRYRSRRDLLEISSNPEFSGRHEFKLAGLDKTIAYPVETTLYYSDPRLLLLLLLFSLAAIVDMVVFRRRT